MKRLISFLYFLILLIPCSWSQKTESFVFHLDKIQIKEKQRIDSIYSWNKLVQDVKDRFKLSGYIGIELTDSSSKKGVNHYYFKAERHFKKTILTEDNKPNKAKGSKTIEQTQDIVLQQLKDLENNGFPFAQLKFIHQKESDEKLFLTYRIDSGEYYTIDKIVVKSEDKIHLKTFLNLINLREGEVYNHSKIENINDILSASKMFGLKQGIQLIYRENKAEIYFFIKKLSASSADGYVGFQQDQITNRLALNGYLNLGLKNAFNRAENLDLHWKSNPDKTQNFHGKFEYPYFFNTPIGAGAQLAIRKQDSTFLRTDISLNLSYTHPFAKVTLFNQIEASSTLRESAPIEYRNYNKNTIGSSISITPPEFNAVNWFHPSLFLSGGFFNYRDDTISDNKQNILNKKYRLEYRHKIDLFKYFYLNNKIRFEGLTSSIGLSRNELLYFGGLNSLRGFYELELNGNDAWMIMNELEFKPVELFSIFILYDYGNFKSNGTRYTNSGGVGFSFKAANTQLQIIVANGVLDDNPLDFTNTKIHLGFKSVF